MNASALVCAFALFTAVGCDGPQTGSPGLEPPLLGPAAPSSSRSGNSQPVMTNTASPAGPAPMQPPASPGAMAGSPSTGSTAPQPAAGAGGSTDGTTTTTPPAEMMPGTMAGAGGSSAGSAPDAGASPANDFGVDFIPECDGELAYALTADGLCSYPLPEGVAAAPDLAKIALLSNGSFTTVEHVAGPLACDVLNGGFYFDSADAPTRISLCSQSCLRVGAAAEMQVVLVLACTTAP